MAVLKQQSQNYLNAYEAAYHRYGSTKGFDQSEWEQEARQGNLDQYIGMLSQSNDFDWDAMTKKYNSAYATPETMLAMKYNETYTDKSLTSRKKRSVLKYNDDGSVATLADGTPIYEDVEMTDYEYYAYNIREANNHNMQNILLQEQQEAKDARNWFIKVLYDTRDLAWSAAQSVLSWLDGALALGQGAVNALFNLDSSATNIREYFTEFADRFVIANADAKGQISLEKMLSPELYEALIEWEMEHTDKYDVDGTPADNFYTNFIVPAVDTLAKSAMSRVVSMGILSNFGAGSTPTYLPSYNTIAQAVSTATFYTYVTGENIAEMYNNFAANDISVPNGQILINATLKSALQATVELAVDKIFGGATQLDNWIFGRKTSTVGNIGGNLRLSGIQKVLVDAVHEGIEEVLQDVSDWFVDRTFKLLNDCMGNPEIADEFGNTTEISMESLINTFLVSALTSVVGSTIAIAGTKRVSTGKVKYDKDGNVKVDKDSNVKYKKLSKLQSYALNNQLSSMLENLNKLSEYYSNVDSTQVGLEYKTLLAQKTKIDELGTKIAKAQKASDKTQITALQQELDAAIKETEQLTSIIFKRTIDQEAELVNLSIDEQVKALRTEYNSLKREFEKELSIHKSEIDANKSEYITAFKAAYGSLRLLAKVATELGDEEFAKTQTIIAKLDSMSGTDIVKAGADLKAQVNEILNFAYDSKGNLVKVSGVNDLEKVIKRLEDAAITEISQVVERGQNIDLLNVSDNTKKNLKDLFEGSEKIQKAVLTEDGNKIVAIQTLDNTDIVFIPEQYAKNADGTVIYKTIAEGELVESICNGDFKGLALDSILETYRKISGIEDATLNEAVWNLVFNQSFFTAMLSVSNKDIYQLLTSLKNIAEKTIAKDKREVAYVDKMKSIVKNMSTAVYNYCILQPYADINIDILTKNQQRKIEAARWCNNLYARVINDNTYKQLSKNDWNVLNARVNSLSISTQEKNDILNLLKSAHWQDRQNAMNRINTVRYAMFTSAYDGKIYMPDTNNANRAFNVWLQNNGLTIEALHNIDVISGDIKENVTTSYGEFNQDNLYKYYIDSFEQSCNERYSFLIGKQNTISIYEKKTGEQVGFSTYLANTDLITSGEALDKRQIVMKGQKDNNVVVKFVDENIDLATKAYLSIDNIINDTSLLKPDIQSKIIAEYGTLNSETAFLYLRDAVVKQYKTRTIIVLSDGTYAFGDVKSMQSLLVNDKFEITDDTKISDIVKKEYLTGRLKDIDIVLTNEISVAEYVANDNTIYINKQFAKQNDSYLSFALLHEFQHAIQIENGMNLGINVAWLNSKSVSVKMRKAIITDIRNHYPDLFKNVDKGSNEELSIANDVVYYASGESDAYGMRGSTLLNFYPIRVTESIKGTTIVTPWGKEYNISTAMPMSLQVQDFYNNLITLIPENEYKDYTETQYQKAFKLLPRAIVDVYDRLREVALNTVLDNADITAYLVAPISKDAIANDIKIKARNALNNDDIRFASQMNVLIQLGGLPTHEELVRLTKISQQPSTFDNNYDKYYKLNDGEIDILEKYRSHFLSRKQVESMKIPIVRWQQNKVNRISDGDFLSYSMFPTLADGKHNFDSLYPILTTWADASIKNGIERDKKLLDKVYISYGLITMKDILMYSAPLSEVLIDINTANNFKQISLNLSERAALTTDKDARRYGTTAGRVYVNKGSNTIEKIQKDIAVASKLCFDNKLYLTAPHLDIEKSIRAYTNAVDTQVTYASMMSEVNDKLSKILGGAGYLFEKQFYNTDIVTLSKDPSIKHVREASQKAVYEWYRNAIGDVSYSEFMKSDIPIILIKMSDTDNYDKNFVFPAFSFTNIKNAFVIARRMSSDNSAIFIANGSIKATDILAIKKAQAIGLLVNDATINNQYIFAQNELHELQNGEVINSLSGNRMSLAKRNNRRTNEIKTTINELFKQGLDENTIVKQLTQKYSDVSTDVLTDIFMSTIDKLKEDSVINAKKEETNKKFETLAAKTEKITSSERRLPASRMYQEGVRETDVIKNTHVSETRKWIEKRPKLDKNGNVIRNDKGQIVYNYIYPTKSRYVSQKEAVGTNLEKYGYTQQYKRTQMSEELKNFIVAASPKIATELWEKVKSGKLTTNDVFDYLRNTSIENFDDNTFKLINDTFFKNSKIKTAKDLDVFVTNTSQYYAMRAVIRAAGFGEALLNNASPQLFEKVMAIIDGDANLKKVFDRIVARYETYQHSQDVKIDEKYLRYLWMKYYDGTLEMAGYIGTIARAIAIAGYRVSGRVYADKSIEAGIGSAKNKNGSDDDLTLADVTEDTTALDAFSKILGGASREEKTSEILQVLISRAHEKHPNASYQQFAKYAAKMKMQLEELSDKEFAKQYAKYVGNMTEEDFNALYLKAVIARTTGIDVNKLSDKQNDELEKIAKTVAKKVTRNNTAIVNNIKSISRTIRANLSAKSKKLFLEQNSDIFDDKGYVKKELYQTTDSKGRTVLKSVDEIQALEDRIRELSKNVQAGDYSSKQALYWRQKFDKQIAKLQAENEKLAREIGKGKETVINVTVADDVLTIDATKEVPDILKRVLATSFKKYAESKTQYLANDGEMHIKMNLETFIKDNAELLTVLTQTDVDAIVDFYTTSDIIVNTNKSRQYMATEIYLGTYLLQGAKLGKFILTEEQRNALETKLETIVSSAGAELAAWKAAKKMLDPVKALVQSLAKKTGIEFRQEDINNLSKALETGDVTRIQTVKQKMYDNAMKDYKGRKKSFLDKLYEFERLAMLSGPGTWVRNQASNVLVTGTNLASEQLGNQVTNFVRKLLPKKWLKKRDEVSIQSKQYKIVGTKVSTETQQWIKTQIIDSKFIDLISDGLSKYNPARFKEATTSDNMVAMIMYAVQADIYQNQTVVGNEVLTVMNKFIAKMMSDNFWIKKSTIRYLGKILTEDNVDLSKGVQNKAVLEHIADAYVMAARDYMHKPNFINDLEQLMREKLGPVGFFAYKQFCPFLSASTNWLLEGMNYTPIGLAKAIVDYAKLENTVDKLELARQRGEKVVSARFADYMIKRRIGKGVLGTIGLVIGAALAACGFAGIDEQDDKYKLKVGNVYIDISNIFGSQGILLGMALVSTCKGGNPWGMFSTALGTLLEESLFSDMYNSFRYANSFGEAMADVLVFDRLNMFVPNFVKTIANIANVYKVKYSKGILGKFEYAAVSSIPFLAYAMPKRYDPYTGEAQVTFDAQFITNLANKLLPFKVYPYHISDIEKEAISLGVNKGELTGKYTVNDTSVNLSTSDRSTLNEFYGKLNASELDDLFKNKVKYKVKDEKTGKYIEITYSRMTDAQKANVIQRIMSDNAEYSKIYILTSTDKYKYYATDAEYNALKKLGITKNVYRAKESKFVAIK